MNRFLFILGESINRPILIVSRSSEKVLPNINHVFKSGVTSGTPLKCALYDVFSMSGCGAYSHTGKKLPSKDSPTLVASPSSTTTTTTTTTTTGRSMLRTTFLQVEKEFYRLLSVSTDETSSSTKSSSRHSDWKSSSSSSVDGTFKTTSISNTAITAFNSLLWFLPRYQYDNYIQSIPLRIQKVVAMLLLPFSLLLPLLHTYIHTYIPYVGSDGIG
jgi:hypothetical protein